tara:strand:+ start:842 stop:1810 length:969 start_codon:yes stop_codon:yes gene_type:complete
MATGNTKIPSLPPLPTNLDPQLRNYLKSVDSHLRIKSGVAGNPKDRNVTLRDLEESNIVSSANTVNDFSITAGDPTVKIIAPNQLITDQVGEENTLKKFSKTSIILASDFATTLSISRSSVYNNLANLSFLSQGDDPSNHTVGTAVHPQTGSVMQQVFTSTFVNATFDFTTAVHSRGGKKPYLITISGRRFGETVENPSTTSGDFATTFPYASQPHWVDTIALLMHEDSIDAITGSTNNHNGDMRLYQRSTATGYGLDANEGEVQLSRFASGLAVVLSPLSLQFISNLRSDTKYRLDLGAMTLGIFSNTYDSLQYTVQGITT